eukprot:scaffold180048_cov33-Tisochrysis_lutea.AAC.2
MASEHVLSPPSARKNYEKPTICSEMRMALTTGRTPILSPSPAVRATEKNSASGTPLQRTMSPSRPRLEHSSAQKQMKSTGDAVNENQEMQSPRKRSTPRFSAGGLRHRPVLGDVRPSEAEELLMVHDLVKAVTSSLDDSSLYSTALPPKTLQEGGREASLPSTMGSLDPSIIPLGDIEKDVTDLDDTAQTISDARAHPRQETVSMRSFEVDSPQDGLKATLPSEVRPSEEERDMCPVDEDAFDEVVHQTQYNDGPRIIQGLSEHKRSTSTLRWPLWLGLTLLAALLASKIFTNAELRDSSKEMLENYHVVEMHPVCVANHSNIPVRQITAHSGGRTRANEKQLIPGWQPLRISANHCVRMPCVVQSTWPWEADLICDANHSNIPVRLAARTIVASTISDSVNEPLGSAGSHAIWASLLPGFCGLVIIGLGSFLSMRLAAVSASEVAAAAAKAAAQRAAKGSRIRTELSSSSQINENYGTEQFVRMAVTDSGIGVNEDGSVSATPVRRSRRSMRKQAGVNLVTSPGGVGYIEARLASTSK